jgi:hypothetical protein
VRKKDAGISGINLYANNTILQWVADGILTDSIVINQDVGIIQHHQLVQKLLILKEILVNGILMIVNVMNKDVGITIQSRNA